MTLLVNDHFSQHHEMACSTFALATIGCSTSEVKAGGFLHIALSNVRKQFTEVLLLCEQEEKIARFTNAQKVLLVC